MESDHVAAVSTQMRRTSLIIANLPMMDAPIQLDHKLVGRAIEVEDERPDRVLPAEFQTCQLPVP